MACYRRAKHSLNTLRNSFTSRPILRSPVTESSSIISQSLGSSIFSVFSSYSSISQRLRISSKYHHNPLSNAAKRFYHGDRHNVQDFRRRGLQFWFQNPRITSIVILLGSVVLGVYFADLETVPYKKRKQFVLLSKETEKWIGETLFKKLKASYKGRILPAEHPESVRVTLIAENIIHSLQRGLSHDPIWSDLEYESLESSLGHDTMTALKAREGELGINSSSRDREDDHEMPDDKWVQPGRNRNQQTGSQPTASHLQGLNWEVLVVNDPDEINAYSLPGGKIVVKTGLLEHFTSDAEIATVIGREVAHVASRHMAEGISNSLWIPIPQLILSVLFFPFLTAKLYGFIMLVLVNITSAQLWTFPLSRRMEHEADDIGLLLLASSGYDPRVALKFFERSDKILEDSPLQNYLTTHPTGKKRAQLLAQAQVMEEALTIYREVKAGRVVKGFL